MQRHRVIILNYKAIWTSLLTYEKAKSTFTRWLLCPNHPVTWALLCVSQNFFKLTNNKIIKIAQSEGRCKSGCGTVLLLTKRTLDYFFINKKLNLMGSIYKISIGLGCRLIKIWSVFLQQILNGQPSHIRTYHQIRQL
jgi:hypothetical protein